MFGLFCLTAPQYYLLRMLHLYIHNNKSCQSFLFVYQPFWYQKLDLTWCQQVNTFFVLERRSRLAAIHKILVGDSQETVWSTFLCWNRREDEKPWHRHQTPNIRKTLQQISRREDMHMIQQLCIQVMKLVFHLDESGSFWTQKSRKSTGEKTQYRMRESYISYFGCVVVWEKVTGVCLVMVVLHSWLEKSLIWSIAY